MISAYRASFCLICINHTDKWCIFTCTLYIYFLNISNSAVAYLDCDVGQTEFTPPAFVSLSFVEKPLFGKLKRTTLLFGLSKI